MPDPIVSMAAAVVPKISKNLIERVLNLCGKELSIFGRDIYSAIFGAFKESIQQSYAKHLYFSPIVFPNQQLLLTDYYIPLTLHFGEGNAKKIVIDKYPGQFISEKKDILIVDYAGMGKSTVLKYIFLKAVELNVGVPIFIELRKLKSIKNSVFDYLCENLRPLYGSIDSSHISRLLASGEFILFLDGYDEIADDIRAAVTDEILDFKRKCNKNRFILSSRDMNGLAAFKDFYRVGISPLQKEEAFQLIEKYSTDKAIGANLVAKLNLDESRPIHEFLTNPLLVSLLYKAYDFKKTVPLKKHVFYRQVFEALYENHDLSKDSGELNRKKKTELDIHSFDTVMRIVGYKTFQSSKIEYAKDELLHILEQCAKIAQPLKLNPHHLIDDLLIRVPLWATDKNTIRWQHKSLQEYFAALYVWYKGSDFQRKILKQIHESDGAVGFVNFLSLLVDVEPKAGRYIILPMLMDEILSNVRNVENTYGVEDDVFYRRQCLTLLTHHYIFKRSKENINASRLREGEELLRKVHKKFNHINAHMRHNENILCVTYETGRYKYLIPLLKNCLSEDESRQILMQRRQRLELTNEMLPKGQDPIVVTDDKSNPLNHVDYYSRTNDIIEANNLDGIVGVDFKALMKLQGKIQKEIEVENKIEGEDEGVLYNKRFVLND
ncbi:NACHT domain-containing protein [Acidovorax sp. NCPPB 4044]|uniref:NACHT domain-containing protein n=1 Tax=Acidovorax sp. NCPPB 4044 TaxID=2940490 RepID=UPI0023047A2A|nr:NACHT domain-containing protein [Acidovorax sp. NCPPB 4044]MDA8521539.1 NACHT domain-containing protein [Acidovorax sp. NCPPB 4044]